MLNGGPQWPPQCGLAIGHTPPENLATGLSPAISSPASLDSSIGRPAGHPPCLDPVACGTLSWETCPSQARSQAVSCPRDARIKFFRCPENFTQHTLLGLFVTGFSHKLCKLWLRTVVREDGSDMTHPHYLCVCARLFSTLRKRGNRAYFCIGAFVAFWTG